MAKIFKKQNLTQEQYKKSNRVMSIVLIISYIVYIIVELLNMGRFESNNAWMIRCGVYVAMIIATLVSCFALSKKKVCMIVLALSFLVAYATLVFGNGVVVIALAFPVLIGFMIYLNSVVVGIGCISTLIISCIKCILLLNVGDKVLFNYGILLMAGLAVATFGSLITINLLINFSKEDRSVIEKEALHRAEVAASVERIVEKLDVDFREMVDELKEIETAIESADVAMQGISGSSESTAQAVNGQAKMTADIQTSIEIANELATNASATTVGLKDVIGDGKSITDELLVQSDIVDKNIVQISDTIEQLVNNVQRVSSITAAIVNISSQTNLLALNASIEAARAGEAGKGFAVVADEIRKLAEETQNSTEKITDIINELIDVTNETQAGIKESSECINVQRMKVDEVSASFLKIEGDMNRLQSDVTNMVKEVGIVLSANTEIVESISLLSAASEEVSAGTQSCRENMDSAFENLENFAGKVDGASEELKVLKETAGV